MRDSTFQSILNQAEKHASIISEDLNEIDPQLPFDAKSILTATPATLRILDQFNIRYAKLQDVLGGKLFPAILDALKEEYRSMAFIDRLSRLESLGFIASADTWLELREQRNRLAHDYPDDPELLASELNAALANARILLHYWRDLKARIAADPHLALKLN